MALVSGTISQATGGKFAIGAATGAMGYLANQLAGSKRAAQRRRLAERGTSDVPVLAEGRYLAVIDSGSGKFGIDLGVGDLWILDEVNGRHIHFGFISFGAGPSIGGSISRQYGSVYVSSVQGIEGLSFSVNADGIAGVGGTGSFQILNQSLDPISGVGGIGGGLQAGLSGVATYTWYKKTYRAGDSPMIMAP